MLPSEKQTVASVGGDQLYFVPPSPKLEGTRPTVPWGDCAYASVKCFGLKCVSVSQKFDVRRYFVLYFNVSIKV